MTDVKELIEELRKHGLGPSNQSMIGFSVADEAADALEENQAEIGVLRCKVVELEDRSPPECVASCNDPDCPSSHDWGPTRAERDAIEIERLRKALRPFAAMADELDKVRQEYQPPYDDPENWSKSCEWGDLVRARAVLEDSND